MVTVGNIKKVREILKKMRKKNKTIGFVPTMGALHAGHLSLVRAAKKETDFVVVSIFINPRQFSPNEDYRRYPRTPANDRRLLHKEGVGLIFYPQVRTLYPDNFSLSVEETDLSRHLCGVSRPTHFKGVCLVVAKLFNIIQPDISYFGQKDYQQAQIIKRMVRDLNFPQKLKVCPIVREPDGLAMSSRNKYLSLKERKEAVCLYHALKEGVDCIKGGIRNSKKVIATMKKVITKRAPHAKIDYLEVVDRDTLEEVSHIQGNVLLALAVRIGKTRLIDNMLVSAR